MSAAAIGQLAARIAGTMPPRPTKRTGQPVRRDSRHVGEREQRQWKASNTFSKREHNARMRALEIHSNELREPGKQTPLNATVQRVYRELLRRRDYKTGQLDLALSTIADLLRLSKTTVVRALARLKAHGWLDWYRRTRPIEEPDPFGPQVEQVSNAYWFKMPAAAAKVVRRLTGRDTPKPADQAQREVDQAAELSAMLDTLSAEELAAFRAGDEGPLAAALQRLGRGIDHVTNASSRSGENPTLQG